MITNQQIVHKPSNVINQQSTSCATVITSGHWPVRKLRIYVFGNSLCYYYTVVHKEHVPLYFSL